MDVNNRVTEAITWALIADIMQRHEATAGLRVIETHPGGGQYDCRTILQPTATDYGPHISFNLQSGNATCFGTFGPRRPVEHHPWTDRDPDRLAYVEAVLQVNDRMEVVRHLEAMLGLPSREGIPAMTRHALSYRVMAEVVARSLLDGPIVRWENGRQDTAGYGSGDPIRSPLHRIPDIVHTLDATAEPQTPADAPGYRYWIWTSRKVGEAAEPIAVLDALDAVMYRLDDRGEAVDLCGDYSRNHDNIKQLADELVVGDILGAR